MGSSRGRPRSSCRSDADAVADALHAQVDDGATVAALKQAIQQQLGVPLEQQRLSKEPGILLSTQNGSSGRCAHGRARARARRLRALAPTVAHTTRRAVSARSVLPDGASLASQGVGHGDQLFLGYDMERQVGRP